VELDTLQESEFKADEKLAEPSLGARMDMDTPAQQMEQPETLETAQYQQLQNIEVAQSLDDSMKQIILQQRLTLIFSQTAQ
jgi:hypothetical protein